MGLDVGDVVGRIIIGELDGGPVGAVVGVSVGIPLGRAVGVSVGADVGMTTVLLRDGFDRVGADVVVIFEMFCGMTGCPRGPRYLMSMCSVTSDVVSIRKFFCWMSLVMIRSPYQSERNVSRVRRDQGTLTNLFDLIDTQYTTIWLITPNISKTQYRVLV